ncbi:MAG: rhodanese-like domain-containing protein [Vicinamibacteria bacterium]
MRFWKRGYWWILASMVLSCDRASSPPEAPQRVEADEIASVLAEENALLLDVREPHEIAELGTIEGYVNIPIDELEARLDELPRDKTILTA